MSLSIFLGILAIAFVMFSAIISSRGWINADERARKASIENKILAEENARLKAIMALNKLQKDMEEDN